MSFFGISGLNRAFSPANMGITAMNFMSHQISEGFGAGPKTTSACSGICIGLVPDKFSRYGRANGTAQQIFPSNLFKCSGAS
jgi:hypothetical protein